MCRRKQLQGCCCICFGLGLITGHGMGSWLVCSMVGTGLVLLGVVLAGRR